MRSAPLVTIIINNYNYARFIGEAIDSALAQTHPAMEVVVVDDGSTDESRDVIARYGGRVRCVLKDNGGQGSAYNAGLAQARGDAVCFLDSDDTLFPSAMERAVELMDDGTSKVQLPLLVTDAHGHSTGELTTKQAPPEGDLRARIAADGPLYDFEFHTGNVYSRRFLDRVFPVPEPPYRNGADVYLTTLAPAYGLLRTTPEPLGTYRAHGANNYRGKQLDEARIENYLARFETNAAVLARALQSLGIEADPAAWRSRNFNYVWLDRLKRAKRLLAELTPAGDKIILVDQSEWGDGQHVPDRIVWPFIERNGHYFGPPENDELAISELERLTRRGASYVAFWWTCFWWFDSYPGLTAYLHGQSDCVANDSALVVFRLREAPQPRKTA